ncbi:MAG: hypothetical protein MZW92_12590 [Comamonadaceae bacterium]|nr:hypothetical protein [Comamonadaceae bacterium]
MTEDARASQLFSNRGYDTFVYALGPDDRVVPNAPGVCVLPRPARRPGGQDRQRRQSARGSRAPSSSTPISPTSTCSSDGSSRRPPSLRQAPASSRRRRSAGSASPGVFDVMFLELPFIFGTMPGRLPLWKEFFLDAFAKYARGVSAEAGGIDRLRSTSPGSPRRSRPRRVTAPTAAAIRSAGRTSPTREILELMLAGDRNREEGLRDPRLDRRDRRSRDRPEVPEAGPRGRPGPREADGRHPRRAISRSTSRRLARDLGYAELGYDGGQRRQGKHPRHDGRLPTEHR